jgi:RNA polymerase sigma factor (sigma-70 family)
MDEFRHQCTVFIIDDDASVRDSLALLLSLRGYRTALFACAEDFLGALDDGWIGCVVADIKMPGMSGLELQAALVERGVRLPVLIITAHGDVASTRAAFKSKAVDFLEKPLDDDQLVAAIETALVRERDRLLLHEHQERRGARLAALSEREREVMALIVQGLHNREIGAQLGISPRTVEVHKARIMAKLDIGTLAELIRLADAELR